MAVRPFVPFNEKAAVVKGAPFVFEHGKRIVVWGRSFPQAGSCHLTQTGACQKFRQKILLEGTLPCRGELG
jgi:hypothetical protein